MDWKPLMAPKKYRIAPFISMSEFDHDFFTTSRPLSLISAWIEAAPKSGTLIGPFGFHSLADKKSVRSYSQLSDLTPLEREAIGRVEANLPAALVQSGFARLRETGFADRVFIADGFWAFAYDSVSEHVAATTADDYSGSGTLLDPILSARTLSILMPCEHASSQASQARFQSALTLIEEVLLQGNDITSVEFDLSCLSASASLSQTDEQRDWLQRRWRRLVEVDLPVVSQRRPWPVHADHCFARILLDHACGRPWREMIAAPAWRNARFETLMIAVLAGERVLAGDTDLQELNRQSLKMRGKLG